MAITNTLHLYKSIIPNSKLDLVSELISLANYNADNKTLWGGQDCTMLVHALTQSVGLKYFSTGAEITAKTATSVTYSSNGTVVPTASKPDDPKDSFDLIRIPESAAAKFSLDVLQSVLEPGDIVRSSTNGGHSFIVVEKKNNKVQVIDNVDGVTGNSTTTNTIAKHDLDWIKDFLKDPTKIFIHRYVESQNLKGSSGNDILSGGSRKDSLYGGAGNNTMQGGDGKDVFVYDKNSVAKGKITRDIIDVFQQGSDCIDFSAIDTNPSKRGDQAFTQVNKFTGKNVGEIILKKNVIQVDVDGSGSADIEITLTGISQISTADLIF